VVYADGVQGVSSRIMHGQKQFNITIRMVDQAIVAHWTPRHRLRDLQSIMIVFIYEQQELSSINIL
jgi:hypothetical protein